MAGGTILLTAALLLLGLARPLPVLAQGDADGDSVHVEPPSPRRSPAARAAASQADGHRLVALGLLWENDVLAVRAWGPPPDHDYTQGIQLTAEFAPAPRALRRWILGAPGQAGAAASGAPGTLRLSVGQRIYTPRKASPNPVPGERPYAGWLFAAGEFAWSGASVEHLIGVELGVTGRPALGEEVQNGFHRLVGVSLLEGWDHQLAPEPGVRVSFGTAWPREVAGLRAHPQLELGVGNLWTGAAGELRLSAGAAPAEDGAFAVGELRQEWVLRDLFLDGNTFRESVRTEKYPWVSQAALGVGYRAAPWSIEAYYVARGREYRSQPVPHGYGSVNLTWRRSRAPTRR